MKVLFIGGTGTISSAIVRNLAEEGNWDIWLINRGNRNDILPDGVHQIIADINDEKTVADAIRDLTFDAVCEFIGFRVPDVERDYRLFNGKTRQYIYTSSASAYNKPAASYIITEGTTLANPYWQYSRDKIACEEYLMKKYREEGFPVTIVRPSHTYDERNIPIGVHGKNGFWQVIRRMLDGKPVIIQGLTFQSKFPFFRNLLRKILSKRPSQISPGKISTFPVSMSYIAPITARPSSSSFRITRLLSMRSMLLFTLRQQAL